MTTELQIEEWLQLEFWATGTFVMAATCVLYDHLLTFGDEVCVVWRRPRWGLPQFLFIINRYAGDAAHLCYLIVFVRHVFTRTTVVGAFVNGASYFALLSFVFFSAQGIMIHRISSMYGHDRKIIFLLLVSFALEVMIEAIIQIYTAHGSQPTLVPAGISTCVPPFYRKSFWLIWIPPILFEGLIFALALNLGFKYYRENRILNIGFRTDSLIFVLLRDSITFPFMLLCLFLMDMVFYFNLSLSVLEFQMLYSFGYTVVCTLGPRLILNLREAYYAPYTEEFDEHWRRRVGVTVDTDDFSFE